MGRLLGFTCPGLQQLLEEIVRSLEEDLGSQGRPCKATHEFLSCLSLPSLGFSELISCMQGSSRDLGILEINKERGLSFH